MEDKTFIDWACLEVSPAIIINLPIRKSINLNEIKQVEDLLTESIKRMEDTMQEAVNENDVYLLSHQINSKITIENNKIIIKERR